MSDLTSYSVLARLLQLKELNPAFVFINLPHAYMISPFPIGLTSSPSSPTKKLKMAEDKNIASNSRPKKPNLPKNVRTPSNVRCSSLRLANQFYFSNTIDNPIEVEEMEDPSESSKQESTFGKEALSEEDSSNISRFRDKDGRRLFR